MRGNQEKLQLLVDYFLSRGELLFLLLSHVLHFRVVGFLNHLASSGEILFNLLEFTMLVDNVFELRMLLGELLEARRIAYYLGSGEFLSHFLITDIELVEFFGERKAGHDKSLSWRNCVANK